MTQYTDPGSRPVSIKNALFNKQIVVEMRFLRPMTLVQKKKYQHKRTIDRFKNINDKLTQYKINWSEHIQRVSENRLPKKN